MEWADNSIPEVINNRTKKRFVYCTCFSFPCILIALFVFSIIPLFSFSQDIHFSQFSASPLNINPAYTGSFEGQYRLMGNYRTQWNSVSIPYKTISFGSDACNLLRQKNIGGGILINNDKAGDSQLNTFQLLLSGSYRLGLDQGEKHYFLGGLQLGIRQVSINFNELSFDSQYNGTTYISSAPNNESFANEGTTSPIINLGAMWQYRGKRTKAILGLSMYNLNRPDQSVFNDGPVKLDSRLNLHGSVQLAVSNKIEVLPSLLFMKQGTNSELMFGTFGKALLNNNAANYKAIYLGSWLRSKDAGCFVLAMDYGNVNVGLSYDLNYSELKQASNKRGGFELSFRYIIKEKVIGRAKYSICPSFI